jgi:iron complex transport system ATP-binding protein
MSVIELRDISFVRGGKKILDRVSWTVEAGEHWALLGANGSGKTTLLKVVTGYEWPTDGEVSVLGETFGACNLPLLRKTIGWVSMSLEHDVPAVDTGLAIVTSGLEASLGLYREFTGEEYELAKRLLKNLGCEHIADQQYFKMSQGERQRVLIARALINRPKMLILDEPCTGLDPAARERFLLDLANLAKHPQAPAMVFVTHHIEEIGSWVNRVMVIKEGQTLASGKTTEVLTDGVMSHAFNCPCEVKKQGKRYRLQIINTL